MSRQLQSDSETHVGGPGCEDYPIVSVSLLVVGLIILIILCAFLIQFIIEYTHIQSDEHSQPSIKRFLIYMSTVFFLICTNLAMILTIVFCSDGDGYSVFIVTIIEALVWFVAGILVNITKIRLLFDAFKQSLYELTKREKLALIIWCVIISILGCTCLLLLILRPSYSYSMSFAVGSIGLFCFLLFHLYSSRKFINTLFEMGIDRRRESIAKHTSPITISDIDEHQKTMNDVISRHLVLTILSSSITFICGIIIGVRSIIFLDINNLYMNTNSNLVLYYAHFMAVMFDTLIHSLCLMLQLSFFGSKKYNKLCNNKNGPFKCHMFCFSIAQYYTVKKMEQERIGNHKKNEIKLRLKTTSANSAGDSDTDSRGSSRGSSRASGASGSSRAGRTSSININRPNNRDRDTIGPSGQTQVGKQTIEVNMSDMDYNSNFVIKTVATGPDSPVMSNTQKQNSPSPPRPTPPPQVEAKADAEAITAITARTAAQAEVTTGPLASTAVTTPKSIGIVAAETQDKQEIEEIEEIDSKDEIDNDQVPKSSTKIGKKISKEEMIMVNTILNPGYSNEV